MADLEPDDDLFAVNSVFLGPAGRPLPWRARYSAYVTGAAIFAVLLVVIHKTHLVGGFTLIVYTLLSTVAVTTAIMKGASPDRPVRAIVSAFVAEVTAPRAPRHHRDRLRCPRVR